jgi:hypothetical protein
MSIETSTDKRRPSVSLSIILKSRNRRKEDRKKSTSLVTFFCKMEDKKRIKGKPTTT